MRRVKNHAVEKLCQFLLEMRNILLILEMSKK